ncbi:MAG: GNAT family N-acetyltransferase [Clostridia bacterium]
MGEQSYGKAGAAVFSSAVWDLWRSRFALGEVLYRDEALMVTINPQLREDSRVMVLTARDGHAIVVMTPAIADKIGLLQKQAVSQPKLRQGLKDAGIRLHGADYLFYFPEADKAALRQETYPEVRRLTVDDTVAFAEFQAAASAGDLDAAYVELDHWAAFGIFDHGRLVSVASMYPWESPLVADLGVLTLPPYRGHGHARRLVRASSRFACGHGFEPQYRCQTDNQASARLAYSAGLQLFGTWEVVSPDSPV